MSGNPRKPLVSNTMSHGLPSRKPPANSTRSSSPSSQASPPSKTSTSQTVARSPSGATRPNRATTSRSSSGYIKTLKEDEMAAELTEAATEIETLRLELIDFDRRCQEYEQQIASLGTGSGYVKALKEDAIAAELAEAATENETLRLELKNFDKRCQQYEQQIAARDTKLNELSTQIKSQRHQPSGLTTSSIILQDRNAELAATVATLRDEVAGLDQTIQKKNAQIAALKIQEDKYLQDIGKFEEEKYELLQKNENLEQQSTEISQRMKAMEKVHGEEMSRATDEVLRLISREKELMEQNQKLSRERNEIRAGREMRSQHSRSSSIDSNANFAPPNTLQSRDSSVNRNEARNATKIILQKDAKIAALEHENSDLKTRLDQMAGGLFELEGLVVTEQARNSRLQWEIDEYRKALGDSPFNGDLARLGLFQVSPNKGSSSITSNAKPGLDSLAEELPDTETTQATGVECQNCRRLEKEREDNVRVIDAQALYIKRFTENAMARGLENIFARDPEDGTTTAPSKKEKELPPPPKEEAEGQSFIQRSSTMFNSGPAPRRPRPLSQMIQPSSNQQPPWEGLAKKPRPMSQVYNAPLQHIATVNEDQSTAPRVPITRGQSISVRTNGHRRTQSDKSDTLNPTTNNSAAATVVNQMYRGPSSRSEAPVSPTLSPGGITPQTSYFAPSALVGSHSNSNSSITGVRVPSSSMRTSSSRPISGEKLSSSSASEISYDSGDVPSPPRTSQGYTNYTGAVMGQNKLRPLRLVQENKDNENANQLRRGISSMADDEVAAKKKANRASWIGWFNKGKEDQTPPKNVIDNRF